MDWKTPLTFNAKLNWLKVNYRDRRCIPIVDKLEIKQYAAAVIGEQYIIPTIKEFKTPDDIYIEELPSRFVLKTNHDSGTVYVCKDKTKFDLESVKQNLENSLKCDFSKKYREWPYKYVKRKILAEQFLDAGSSSDLRDYKFFCFNGSPKFLKVDFDRDKNHRANYYSLSWQLLPFGEAVCPPAPNRTIEKPQNFDLMIELAAKLAADFPFVRVDFYNIEGEIYLGEMTLFPAAGFGHFIPKEADLEIGHLLDLSSVNN